MLINGTDIKCKCLHYCNMSSAVVWKCGSDTLKGSMVLSRRTGSARGQQMYSDYTCCSGHIPKSPCLILAHLSLFSWHSTMSSAPRRIIGLHCRRQTIYWHFASLNNTVCCCQLPSISLFAPYVTTQYTHTLFEWAPNYTHWNEQASTADTYSMCTQHRLDWTYDL